MDRVNSKLMLKEPVKCSLFAFVMSTIFVLVLALIAKIFAMSPGILPSINQVLKAISMTIACIVSLKNDHLLVKGGLAALMYSVLNCILFVCLGGDFDFGVVGIDFGVALAVAIVVCLIKARKR